MDENNEIDARRRVGIDHPLYRGGTTHDSNGYVVLSSREYGSDCGRREHRVVAERALGRRLRADEVVHHINGDKSDNRAGNLSIETRASHNRKHGKGEMMRCAKCGTERWYSPGLIRLMHASVYMCRGCRFGHTWSNGRSKNVSL